MPIQTLRTPLFVTDAGEPRSESQSPAGPQSSAAGPAGGEIPLYYRLYAALREKIMAGVWPPPRPLPTEAELSAFYGVSRVTVRRAMALLEEQGLIWRQRGRGTFVNDAVLSGSDRSNFGGLMENINDFQLVTTVQPIRIATVAANAEVARRLEVAGGSDVLQVVRVRHRPDGPISHVTCHVRFPEAAIIDPDRLGNRPVLAALEAAGIRVDRVEQGLSAVNAAGEVADRLEVPVGAALISMWRVVRDTVGRPVEFIRSLYRPDRYEYRVALSRHAGSTPPRWVPLD
ncbi:GntR family transcriptional regulator [Stappia stellulata]|uniref:GntR family transcriptional regulator n=1 Tax=Stappia stellulata TaxID=71235 RepID=UPI000405A959|nr:GntR family transcriptional regulator [Stappia stellulata]